MCEWRGWRGYTVQRSSIQYTRTINTCTPAELYSIERVGQQRGEKGKKSIIHEYKRVEYIQVQNGGQASIIEDERKCVG